MDWVPGRTWGWLGPSGSLCNELFIHFIGRTWGWLGPSGSLCNELFLPSSLWIGSRGEHGVGWAPRGLFVTKSSFIRRSQRQHHEQVQQRRQAQEQLVQQQRQQLAAAKLEALKRQAVARFWELLLDFVVLRVAPASWLTQLAPDHPFLRVHGDRLAAHCVPPSLPGG
jgi:hypothetical protein